MSRYVISWKYWVSYFIFNTQSFVLLAVWTIQAISSSHLFVHLLSNALGSIGLLTQHGVTEPHLCNRSHYVTDEHVSIASAAGRSYVAQKLMIAERLCCPKLHVPKAYRLLWHCHWGWVQELSQLEYNTEEKQQQTKWCYFAVLGLYSPLICLILHLPILHLLKVQFDLYSIQLFIWGCQAYDKHNRNIYRGWFIISLEVQILSHLVQKDANSERGWLCKRR